jgi:hypothetical protein
MQLKARTFLVLLLVSITGALIFQNCSQVNFNNDGGNNGRFGNLDVARVKPSLAVSNGVCVNCHSVINGNYVTDFASNGSPVDFLRGDANSTNHVDFFGAGAFTSNWVTYGNRSYDGTSFVKGTIILPKVILGARTQTNMAALIQDEKSAMPILQANESFTDGSASYPNSPVLMPSALENVTTAAQYLNSVLNYRSEDYLTVLTNWKLFPAKTIQPDTQIREVLSVSIGAPSATMIRDLLPNGQKLLYIAAPGSTLSLSNFSLSSNGLYYTNSPTTTFVCDGDLIVDGAVFLNSLQLFTQTGCRIYATGTIFVQAAAGTGARQGIQYLSGSATQNLELTSAVEVALGLGQCTNTSPPGGYAVRVAWDTQNLSELQPAPSISAISSDYNSIVDGSGNSLLQDASPTCGSYNDSTRLVGFQHLLINAPRIDSRYTGDFDGVIITKFLLWSRGMFHFAYDSTFDNVAILPKIPSSSFFAVSDCVANGADSSKAVDTKFRSCN